jgi:hypothetical protein
METDVFFIVHVWRDASGFRATARDVMREDADEFDDPVELLWFLVASCAVPPGKATGGEP